MTTQKPQIVKFAIRIGCLLDSNDTELFDDSREYLPAFRGRLHDVRFDTLPVSKRAIAEADGNRGWTEFTVGKVGAAEEAVASTKKSAGKGGKDKLAEDAVADVKPLNKRLFINRFETQEVKADLDFAWKFNQQPFLNVTMSLNPEVKGQATEDAKTKKPSDKEKAVAPAPLLPAIPYAFWLPIDLSPMFLGQSSVITSFGDLDDFLSYTATQSQSEVSAVQSQVTQAIGEVGGGRSAFSPPRGVSFLSIAVDIISCREAGDQTVTPPSTAKSATKPSSKQGSSAPAAVVEAAPSLPLRLFPASFASVLKPIRFVVRCADGLPGIRLAEGTDRSMQRYLKPTEYSILHQHCRPTFAVVRIGEMLAGTDTKVESSALTIKGDFLALSPQMLVQADLPRVIICPGIVQGSKITWNVESVVCVGDIHHSKLVDIFSSRPLLISVHDRDLPVWEALQEGSRAPKPASLPEREDLSPPADATSAASSIPASKPQSGKQTPAGGSRPGTSHKAPASGGGGAQSAATSATLKEVALKQLVESGSTNRWAFPQMPLARLSFFQSLWTGTIPCPYEAFHSHVVAGSVSASESPATSRPTSSGKNAVKPGTAKSAKSATSGDASALPTEFKHSLDDIDELFYRECWVRVLRARERQPHGISAIRLDTLLNMDPIHLEQEYKRWDCHSAIVPSSRTYVPVIPEPFWALSAAERLCQAPAAFTDAASRLKAAIYVPNAVDLHATTGMSALCNRMVIRIPYDDEQTLQTIMGFIENRNSKAFPHIHSFRSYELTPQEKQALADGTLDAITGLQVIDTEQRLFILESKMRGLLSELYKLMPRAGLNSAERLCLANFDVTFASRMYSSYHICPKMIKLRVPLQKILCMPGVYDPATISKELLLTIESFRRLAEARMLSDAKAYDFFPSVDGLQELERKFGGAVTLSDVFGATSKEAHAVSDAEMRLASAANVTEKHLGATLDMSKLLNPITGLHIGEDEIFETHQLVDASYVADTHAPKNFIEANKLYIQELSQRVAKADKPEYFVVDDGSPVYPYGGQSLNSTAAAMDKLREILKRDKKATFTQSMEFMSQTVDLIDPAKVRAKEIQTQKSKWKTPSGFVYPAPKAPSQYGNLLQPTATRVEELKEAFVDDAERAAVKRAEEKRAMTSLTSPYRVTTEPSPLKDGLFGYTDSLNNKVPDNEFYKSVHLPPGGVETELKAAAEKAKATWRSKVVVDTTSFIPFHSADAVRVERYRPMLRDEPHKKALKELATGKLGSTTFAQPLEKPPISMTLTEPWEDQSRTQMLALHSDAGSPKFKVPQLPPKLKDSHIHSPLKMAGLAIGAPPGQVVSPITHKRGINTDQ